MIIVKEPACAQLLNAVQVCEESTLDLDPQVFTLVRTFSFKDSTMNSFILENVQSVLKFPNFCRPPERGQIVWDWSISGEQSLSRGGTTLPETET